MGTSQVEQTGLKHKEGQGSRTTAGSIACVTGTTHVTTALVMGWCEWNSVKLQPSTVLAR